LLSIADEVANDLPLRASELVHIGVAQRRYHPWTWRA
jgi:hypothetical protein